MEATGKIIIETIVNAPIEKVWEVWSNPSHIVKWNAASDDWHTTKAENDLRTGGKFSSRMEARDGSFGFDFGGIYDEVVPHQSISYSLGDGRKVLITFGAEGTATKVIEAFDPEDENPAEMQRSGWQAILDNFKKYTESL